MGVRSLACAPRPGGCHAGGRVPGRRRATRRRRSKTSICPGSTPTTSRRARSTSSRRTSREFPAPCPAVAVPIAQCVIEKRACPACLPGGAGDREGRARRDGARAGRGPLQAALRRRIAPRRSPSRGPRRAGRTRPRSRSSSSPTSSARSASTSRRSSTPSGRSGKTEVRFVYKFMPLAMHPHGESAARAAIAAQAQGKFWEMHRQALRQRRAPRDSRHRRVCEGHRPRPRPVPRRHAVAGDHGAPRCRPQARRRLGVKGTPTIFINGREYDTKIDIDEWVDGEIAASDVDARD